MIKLICLIISMLIISPSVFAYKVFSYDENGNRVYYRVERKDYAYRKNQPRRAYRRVPRKNWEITESMRANKHTFSYYKSNN